MKKIVALLLCAILLAGMVCTASAAVWEQNVKYVYSSNGKAVRLRAAACLGNNIILEVPYGAKVYDTQIAGGAAGWSYVTYNGKSGWMMSKYLVNTRPTAKPTAKPTISPTDPKNSTDLNGMFKGFAQVDSPYVATLVPTTATANLRWAPSKQSGIMEKLLYGHKVTVLATNRNWAQVRDEETGKVGFMWLPFVLR